MSVYIPESFRKIVPERALFKCEYCKTSEQNTFYRFQVDHIISLKHGGETVLENLAYACPICNRSKGSDLGTIITTEGPIIPFFHPRKDVWSEHFGIHENGIIFPKSPTGEATLKIFGMNHPDSVIERALLLKLGLFP